MGEYFAPVICTEDWKDPGYYRSHAFGEWIEFKRDGVSSWHLMGNGSKICEHYYVGNDMVDAVCSWLRRGVYRVAWLGDYTDEAYVPPKVPRDLYTGLMAEVWNDAEAGKKAQGYWVRELPVPIPPEPCGHKWLANLDKGEVVRLPGIKPDRWAVSPLPVLTTTDGVPGYDNEKLVPDEVIGSWAWDRLTIYDEFPGSGWHVLKYNFGTEVRFRSRCPNPLPLPLPFFY